MIAFDTETRNLRWWEGSAFLATWAGADWEDKAALSIADDAFVAELSNHDALIAHNLKFDAHQLRCTIGYDVWDNHPTLHDTAIMSKIVYGRQRPSHDLESLSKDLLPNGGKAATKASISDIYKSLSGRSSMAWDDAYWDVWVEDPEALEAYAMADVRDTYDLFHVLWPQIQADERLARIYELEMETLRVVYHAERRGVRVDRDAVARLQAYHSQREAAAAAQLEEQLGFLPEGEGSDELLRRRLPELGVELTERTEKTQELAVNERALERFADHPAVEALFDWRRSRKFQTTYLDAFTGKDVIHTDFNTYGAKTSRFTSSRPNLQNLPKRQDKREADKSQRIRSVFVPREGYAFLVCDYEQIEPKLLAYYVGSPEYRKIVAENRVYEHTCVAAWGGQESDYVEGGPRGDLRDAGKMVFLAVSYGGGGKAVRNNINKVAPPEFQVDVGWRKDPNNKYDTPPQANAIKKKVVAAIPGYNALASTSRYDEGRIKRQLRSDGFIRSLFGRKQHIELDKAYQGINALIQTSAADVFKQAVVDVARVLEPHGGYPLLFVHDEILSEVPIDKAEELLPVVAETMENAVALDPPLTVDASTTEVSYAHA